MSRLKRAGMSVVVGQGFMIAGTLVSFLTVPLYLGWLGDTRYGLMLTALACAGYLMFSDAGLSWSSMLLISHASGRKDRAEIARIVRNSFTLAILSALVVFCVVVPAAWWLHDGHALPFFPRSEEAAGLCLAVGLQVMCSLLVSPAYNVFIGLQEGYIAAAFQGSGRLLASLAALGMAWRGGTLGWIVAAGAGVNLAFGLLAFLYARRQHGWAFRLGNFFDAHQIRTQLRTGAKSFGFQIGAVLLGTAPVFAISSQAGPEFVPLFTVPLTLITLPLSFLATLNANLQAGYGEAFAAGDHPWVAGTLRKIIITSLLLVLPLAVGHALLGGAFIELWTRGRLAGETLAITSALAVGVITSFLSTARFALSGINRHRQAALGEITNGLLALALAPLLVKFLGYQFVGVAIVLATLATSGWILPRELMRHLKGLPLWPSASVVLRFVLAAALSAGFSFWLGRVLPVAPALRVPIVGACIAGVYFSVLWLIAREQFTPFVALARRAFHRRARS